MSTLHTCGERCMQFLASLIYRPPQGGFVEYVVIGFICHVIGYCIGIAHHVRQLEAEIKLRNEWESMAKGLVQAAAEYDGVAKNSTQQAKCKT